MAKNQRVGSFFGPFGLCFLPKLLGQTLDSLGLCEHLDIFFFGKNLTGRREAMVTKNAVIGIDLGADTSFVGYVGKAEQEFGESWWCWNRKLQTSNWKNAMSATRVLWTSAKTRPELFQDFTKKG